MLSMKAVFTFCILLLSVSLGFAQYSLQSPLAGHEGIHYTDEALKSWAKTCQIERGLKHIENPSLGYATLGNAEVVIGPPTVSVLSLGDGGTATMTFDPLIKNGDGPDFVIFENGFRDPDNDTLAFLELAFVEVSSNGIDFFRFPAESLMQTDTQIGNSDYVDARYYHNLAGKYIAGYGTPFNLDDIEDHPQLNKHEITHVKVIDVVGSIKENIGTKDHFGNIINDPYPTPFPSSGFDLAAVGVLNEGFPKNIDDIDDEVHLFYPNPSKGTIYLSEHFKGEIVQVFDINGRLIWEGRTPKSEQWELSFLKNGMYFIQWKEKVFKLMIQL